MVECMINNLQMVIQTRPDWAPLGQQQFIELVSDRYYDGAALFRAINDFLVQFGLASTKGMRDKWRARDIKDDPKIDVPFTRGIMSFAGGGPNTRGTQIFFTLAQLSTHLGKEPWEVPFARVIYGEDALQSINTEYGDNVSQQRIWQHGYEYLKQEFPRLSYIEYCRVISEQEMQYYINAAAIKSEPSEQEQEHNHHDVMSVADNDNHFRQIPNYFNKATFISIASLSMSVCFVAWLCCFLFKRFRNTSDKNR
mmetsp:Transcript_31760/g.51395  ORF Transcript_31760/g.51395 Transcript_31760/m.51395 type:complete len:253 (-) Transcript_31760:51-809(-)